MSKTVDDILKLGDPRLYDDCDPITQDELHLVLTWVKGLHEAMEDSRRLYGFGRGIAAPQLGIMKRLVYININQPLILINPEIKTSSIETFEIWDDCMSFPNLLVKVNRHKSLTLKYKDLNWIDQSMNAQDGLSELIQHETDHLDGVLCTMRAIDSKSFRWNIKAE